MTPADDEEAAFRAKLEEQLAKDRRARALSCEVELPQTVDGTWGLTLNTYRLPIAAGLALLLVGGIVALIYWLC